MTETQLISQIEESVSFLKDYEKNLHQEKFGDWEDRFHKETSKLINRDYKINAFNIQNFRGKQIFVADRPRASFCGYYNSSKVYYGLKKVINMFLGSQRGGIREALDAFGVMEKMELLELLKKYPNTSIGNPLNINHKGYIFTFRYIRHVYLLSLFKKFLADRFNASTFTVMDIGCSYGIFSSLVKQEFSESRHVLVDMSGQLVLAHYYLSKLFPSAKIAGFKEVGQTKTINKDFVSKYDFILVPTSMYHLLEKDTVDCVTNFISLSEMSRYWFDTYLQSAVFKSAPYIFTVNRYDAYPTYSNNLTILDYPLKDYEPFFMRTCPFLLNYYPPKFIIWYSKVNYPSQFFQFIGRRINPPTKGADQNVGSQQAAAVIN